MLSKKFASAVFALGAAVFPLAATGIGPQLNTVPVVVPGHSNVIEYGIACSVKFDTMPVYWALSTDLNSLGNYFAAELTGDYWFCNPVITNNWKWFCGLGAAVGTGMNTDNVFLELSPRAVVGMNWLFCDGFLELYTQAAFQPGIRFVLGDDADVLAPFRFPANVGLRFHF